MLHRHMPERIAVEVQKQSMLHEQLLSKQKTEVVHMQPCKNDTSNILRTQKTSILISFVNRFI